MYFIIPGAPWVNSQIDMQVWSDTVMGTRPDHIGSILFRAASPLAKPDCVTTFTILTLQAGETSTIGERYDCLNQWVTSSSTVLVTTIRPADGIMRLSEIGRRRDGHRRHAPDGEVACSLSTILLLGLTELLAQFRLSDHWNLQGVGALSSYFTCGILDFFLLTVQGTR